MNNRQIISLSFTQEGMGEEEVLKVNLKNGGEIVIDTANNVIVFYKDAKDANSRVSLVADLGGDQSAPTTPYLIE